MPGPLQAAGAAPEPTEYAPLTMDRYITGLWTQRSLLRDADVPYLYGKFYSATRFDSLLDGLNREVSAKLTMIRRPGHTIYNENIFPPIRSYFSYKFIQNGVQQLRVLADTATAIYDATPPGQTYLLTKSPNAGPTRFLGVGNQLFMADGVDLKKLMAPSKTWMPNTQFNAGDLIADSNGYLQYVMPNSAATANITNIAIVQSIGTGPASYCLVVTFNAPAPAWAVGTAVAFNGLTDFIQLNGQSFTYQTINTQATFGFTPTANQSCFLYIQGPLAQEVETGTCTGASSDAGVSGATEPTWPGAALGVTTPDGNAGLVWTSFGSAIEDWDVPDPTTAPTLQASANDRYWMPQKNLGLWYAILDSNQNIEVITENPGPGAITGTNQPTWAVSQGGLTIDGSFGWRNCGNLGGSWQPAATVTIYQTLIDSNQNLQVAWGVIAPGTTGDTTPVWATALGAQTTDGNITWACAGPAVVLVSGSLSYAYSYHSIDGSVTNASPLATIPNGILGTTNGFSITLTGPTVNNSQFDQIYIWRTDQGGATLVFRAKIPNPTAGTVSTWTWTDTDPSSGALNPLISAPINLAASAPPAGATAPAYHLQRIWMIVGSQVVWSAGPDAVNFNGNTAFPPANSMQFPESLTKLIPLTTNSGAALVIIGTANSYAILGSGTASDPFYPVSYMQSVGALNYDAITVVGSTLYLFTNNSKFASLDPSAGYVEAGFPIGDQFVEVTTGDFEGNALFQPETTMVSWYEKNSGDSAIYVADGQVGWFRYSPVAAPESGFLWSPLAAVVGGTSAVQSVETATGKVSLLVGPSSSGPILMRDDTVNADNGELYESWMTLGNIVLCESGEVAEVAHVALDAMRVGDRPQVGMLYGEISTTPTLDFDMLDYTSVDPPGLEESQTLYSDRYTTLQDGVTPKCRHVQILIEWPPQNVPDELLAHAIYGAKFGERRQAA